MAAKTRGSKRRNTEEKKRDLKKKNTKENVLHTEEASEQVDEEDQRLQSEKGALTQKLHRLGDERDSVRTLLAKLTRQRDECLHKEENLEEEVKRTQKQLDLVQQRMVQRKLPPLPKEVYFEVAKHVHESEALAFAMTCRASRDAMKEALKERKGNTETSAKWLRTSRRHFEEMENVPLSEEWIKWAFSMKWEYADESEYNERNKEALLTRLAGCGGFKDVLVWLKSEGCVLGPEAGWGAAQGGDIELLKYLKSEGVEFGEMTSYYAAGGGQIHVLKYLKSEGVTFDYRACNWAAEGGHIKVLKYLKSEGVPFDYRACNNAAYQGHIEVLKYLKSEGVAFDSDTCRHAAIRGQLEILKWLRSEEVKCPWNIHGCLWEAEVQGHDEVATWIESFL